MTIELEQVGDLGAELCRRARARGVFLIWRAQSRAVRRVVVQDGRAEATASVSTAGHGLQVVDADGRSALASRDDLREEPALELLDRVAGIARQGETLGLERARVPALPVLHERRIAGDPAELHAVDLEAVTRRLVELEREIRAGAPGVGLELSYRAEIEAWRVLRSDGADVLWTVPRCTLAVRATSDGAGSRHGVPAAVFAPSPRALDDERTVRLFLRRAAQAAHLARRLPDAPPHPAGSFPLVIDYGLAKGLAHEAFGHASEADGFRSSILAREGRFRVGETVGASHVSIIDEPVEGDHAWQPFSSNGQLRGRAVLVDHGRLRDALADPWSTEAAAGSGIDAARAESFRHAPQPRMSNIRIEVDEPLPAPGEFEEYGPAEVRDLLARAGVLGRHPRVVYLSGYAGGQVNTASGDFVFQCKAIHTLDGRGAALHRPAIFSGSMFGALASLREAFGPLCLDAIGYCGKWGQSVPSSGGSHYFLVLEPHDDVRLGGR